MNAASLVAAVLLSTAVSGWAAPLPADTHIEAVAPGRPLPNTAKKPLANQLWYSVALRDGALALEPATASRPADWLRAAAKKPTRFTPQDFKPAGLALALPADALFAFHLPNQTSKRDVALKAGLYPSLLAIGPMVGDGWKTRFKLGKGEWQVQARYDRRPDGVLLAGSMRLELKDPDGGEQLWLSPADAMAFAQQEVLWIGDLNDDKQPDLLLRRTRLTGEIEYALQMDGRFGGLAIDPEQPARLVHEAIEGRYEFSKPSGWNSTMPPEKFGQAAFSISAAQWHEALKGYDLARPKTLFDRQLKLKDEPIRFSFDYLPRVQVAEGSTSLEEDLWPKQVVVRVHFRGKTQILMEAAQLDDGPFNLQVDELDGQPAIRVYYYPHHANRFIYYWQLAKLPQTRFQRVLIHKETE